MAAVTIRRKPRQVALPGSDGNTWPAQQSYGPASGPSLTEDANPQVTSERLPPAESAALPAPQRLPPVPSIARNDPRMTAVNRDAGRMILHGRQLAERGAVYAARAEFIRALRTLAAAQDVVEATDLHDRAISSALLALREARFRDRAHRFRRQPQSAAHHRWPPHACPARVGPRRTFPAGRATALPELCPRTIRAGCGRPTHVVVVLYGLGRLAAMGADQDKSTSSVDKGQSMVCFQAALTANPQNFRAANELGVMMAETGRWDLARDLFIACLNVNPQPAAWANLTVAYERLGQPALAQRARARVPRGGPPAEMNLRLARTRDVRSDE